MFKSPSSSIQFNGQRDTGRNPRGQSENQTEAEPIPHSENQRVSYHSCKHAERPVLSAQQVIRQVETAQHIQTCARNADGCNCVMVHATMWC